jgi:hypothetical protein
MKSRCYNPNNKGYPRYGGRGIAICDRWRNSFDNFYIDMGDRPNGMTLERMDNDSDYKPGNCKWATHATQSLNKRNNIWLTYRGRRRVIADWAKMRGIGKSTIRERIRRGLSIQKILSRRKRIN